MRLASRAAMLRARSGASILHCDHGACGRSSLYDCAKKVYKLNSQATAGKVYPHEIGIQETHTKHRKLDSQAAALSHRARDRAADGLRAQVRPLWASRRDHDPGRLPPRSAGLGDLRPAM